MFDSSLRYLILLLLLVVGTTSVQAETINVTINGVVEFNQITSGFLGNVNPGDAASILFDLDTNNFADNPNFPTRGYEIDLNSFELTFAGATIGLQNPFPAGETPYFVIRDNDPAVDGFFISTDLDGPIGVPIDQPGVFGQFENDFLVTYNGSTLSSLDILDAIGSYDFTGLTVFNWTVNDGPFQPMGMIFQDLTISRTAIPEPTCVIPLLCTSVFLLQRRRSNAISL